MDKETKCLSKKQTKRNIQKHVQELLKECDYNQEDYFSSDISSQSTSYSIRNAHLDLNQNLGLNSDVRNIQQQDHDFSDEESLNEVFKIENFSKFSNNLPKVSEESHVSEEHYSSNSKTLQSNLLNKLKHWALTYNITLSALDNLLLILRDFHPDIRLSGRSLLHTPKSTEIIHFQNGKFTYFGICKQLNPLLEKEPCSKIIDLDFNFDGLPLFKSNNIGVWPILCRSLNLKSYKPFIVGLFTGKGKPEPVDLYLQDLIQELNDILQKGIQISHKLFQVRIRSIICDAPARAFLKSCVGHNSRYGCEKCNVEGEYINHRMIFSCTSGQLRIKDTFNKQIHEEHHKGVSPLLNLDLDLVRQIPLDPMHLVYLGIMKKLLVIWVSKGKPPYKLSAKGINDLSEKLISISSYIPHEFSRKPRGILELNRWKATEFRLFLLYVGPVVLINILPKQLYNHFLMLHVGIRILCNDNHISKHIDFAEDLLNNFVKYIKDSYGKEIVTYNVHSLIHLVTDVRNLGNLNTINCFPFENYLGKLKTLVRSPKNPHEQLCRRINELFYYSKMNISITEIQPKQKHFEGPLVGRESHSIVQYRKLITHTYLLSIFPPDDCVTIEGNIIIKILNILHLENQSYCLIGRQFQNVSEFYNYPCSSKLLNIFKVSCISPHVEEFSFASVRCKNVLIPGYEKETYIVYPLLHEL